MSDTVRAAGPPAPSPRLAILAHEMDVVGGVPAVVAFLRRQAVSAGFAVELFSAATSWRDEASLRLLSPRTWWRGARLVERGDAASPRLHSGALGAEIELQRYRPRRALTRRFDRCDLVQVVAGTPAWANLALRTRAPVALQVASLGRVERQSALAAQRGPRRAWSAAMVALGAGIERRALARADVVLVENREMVARLAAGPAAGRVVLAPPGVDLDRFRPADGPRRGGWLCIARFGDPRKNTPLLLRAYALARARRADLPRLVLAGASGLTPVARDLVAELGLGPDLELLGFVPEAELPALYRRAALFLLPSNEEGLGLVLLEAMASGLAILSTATAGAREVVREGEVGHLVPVGDVEAFAAKLIELHDHPEAVRRLGEEARRVAQREYSQERCGERFVAAWRQLLAAGRRGRIPTAAAP